MKKNRLLGLIAALPLFSMSSIVNAYGDVPDSCHYDYAYVNYDLYSSYQDIAVSYTHLTLPTTSRV